MIDAGGRKDVQRSKDLTAYRKQVDATGKKTASIGRGIVTAGHRSRALSLGRPRGMSAVVAR